MKLYDDVTARILDALAQGVAPWVRPWATSGAAGGLPRNGASGRPYSGVNRLILALATFADARWYTYRQAQAAGGQVRRGEKGTRIVLFISRPAPDATDDGADEDRRARPLYREFTVFNREQCEWPGEPANQDGEGEASVGGSDAVQAILAASGANVAHGSERAAFFPGTDRITMPNPGAFTDAGAYEATLLHELAHWTGHASRLARPFGPRGSDAYAVEELVAELTSAYLCAACGVDGHLQHAEYLGSWMRVIKADAAVLLEAARAASAAADYLLKAAGMAQAVAA